MGGLDVMKVIGLALVAALVIQTIIGTRVAQSKGGPQEKVHRWLAYGIVTAAVIHGAFGLGLLPRL